MTIEGAKLNFQTPEDVKAYVESLKLAFANAWKVLASQVLIRQVTINGVSLNALVGVQYWRRRAAEGKAADAVQAEPSVALATVLEAMGPELARGVVRLVLEERVPATADMVPLPVSPPLPPGGTNPPSPPPRPPRPPPVDLKALEKQLGAKKIAAGFPPPPRGSGLEGAPFLNFRNLTGQGSVGKTRALVWNTDADFKNELTPYGPLQLVDLNKTDCTAGKALCAGCAQAWKATSSVVSVPIFFKDPMNINRIYIKQLKNSGVVKVQALKWSYPAAGVVSDATLGRVLYTKPTDDSTACQTWLTVRVGKATLPAKLLAKTIGGVVITVARPAKAGPNYGPYIEYVRFGGRAIYPTNPAEYLAPGVAKKKL
eukprot:XP_001693945.1 predicted protein [Chlamydomonas reinhardtii]